MKRRIGILTSGGDCPGLNATIRRTLGSDIEAACGQLRRDAAKNKMNGGAED